jgi:hypothetical protein
MSVLVDEEESSARIASGLRATRKTEAIVNFILTVVVVRLIEQRAEKLILRS